MNSENENRETSDSAEELQPRDHTDEALQKKPDGEELVKEEEKKGRDEEAVEFDLEAQIEAFRRQIEEEPDNCVHHYNLGEALQELRQYDEARAEFKKALEVFPD